MPVRKDQFQQEQGAGLGCRREGRSAAAGGERQDPAGCVYAIAKYIRRGGAGEADAPMQSADVWLLDISHGHRQRLAGLLVAIVARLHIFLTVRQPAGLPPSIAGFPESNAIISVGEWHPTETPAAT